MNCKKFDINQFNIIQNLGEGALSEVYLVEDNKTKQKYALKKINKELVEEQNVLYQVFLEKLFLSTLKTDYLLKFYGTTQDENNLYFLLEYAQHGSLNDLILYEQNLSIDVVRYIMIEILNMLQFLRTNGIIHRDIKPNNILITKDYKLKLIDFGTAKVIQQENNNKLYNAYYQIKQTYKNQNVLKQFNHNQNLKELPSFVGTVNYVAPEILIGKQPTFGTDLWSFSVILYKLLTNQFPFKGHNSYSIFKQIKTGQILYPDDINQDAMYIMKNIFIEDQNQRLGNGLKNDGLDFESLKQNCFFIKNNEQKNKLKKISYFLEDKQNYNNLYKNKDYQVKQKIVLAKGLVKKYKYWFFYNTRQIVIYTNKQLEYINPYTNQVKGTINLGTCNVKKQNEYDFTIKTKNRVFYFRSLNEISDYWVSLISKINNQYQQ